MANKRALALSSSGSVTRLDLEKSAMGEGMEWNGNEGGGGEYRRRRKRGEVAKGEAYARISGGITREERGGESWSSREGTWEEECLDVEGIVLLCGVQKLKGF